MRSYILLVNRRLGSSKMCSDVSSILQPWWRERESVRETHGGVC
jgi:hypothetical protein